MPYSTLKNTYKWKPTIGVGCFAQSTTCNELNTCCSIKIAKHKSALKGPSIPSEGIPVCTLYSELQHGENVEESVSAKLKIMPGLKNCTYSK